jgi:tetratricopeptide (TPR) repeat protein
MAASLAVVAKKQEQGWLDYVLTQRVVIPSALEPKFSASPFTFATADPQWIRPSLNIMVVLGRLAFRSERHQAQAVYDQNTTTIKLVADQLRLVKCENVDQVARIASTVWPVFIRSARLSGSEESDLEVLVNFVLAVAQQLMVSEEAAIRWLDEINFELSQAILNAECHSSFENLEDGIRLGQTETLITAYPLSAPLHFALALKLKTSGRPEEAWEAALKAIQLAPDNETVWRATSLVLDGVDEVDAKIASDLAETLRLAQLS